MVFNSEKAFEVDDGIILEDGGAGLFTGSDSPQGNDAPEGSIYLRKNHDFFIKEGPGVNDWVLKNFGAAASWLLAGNLGTDPLVDFLGTSDNKDVSYRSNNIIRYKLLKEGNLQVDFGLTKKNEIDSDITIPAGYTMVHDNLEIPATKTIEIDADGDLII